MISGIDSSEDDEGQPQQIEGIAKAGVSTI
jgi:hypothetical protein